MKPTIIFVLNLGFIIMFPYVMRADFVVQSSDKAFFGMDDGNLDYHFARLILSVQNIGGHQLPFLEV